MMSTIETMQRRLNRQGKSKLNPLNGPSSAWQAISEANRVFGFQNWDREILEMRCASTGRNGDEHFTAYVAKIRIGIAIEGEKLFRDAHGCGEGRGSSAFIAHDKGLKSAELDATLRALATFGKPFGLHHFAYPQTEHDKASSHSPSKTKPKELNKDDPPESALVMASDLMIPKQRRIRSMAHIEFVRQQPCLICGRKPSDAHHLRFMQPRAMAKKVSDEFTVPLCRRHHDLLHRDGNELDWWIANKVDAEEVAADLWNESQRLPLSD